MALLSSDLGESYLIVKLDKSLFYWTSCIGNWNKLGSKDSSSYPYLKFHAFVVAKDCLHLEVNTNGRDEGRSERVVCISEQETERDKRCHYVKKSEKYNNSKGRNLASKGLWKLKYFPFEIPVGWGVSFISNMYVTSHTNTHYFIPYRWIPLKMIYYVRSLPKTQKHCFRRRRTR